MAERKSIRVGMCGLGSFSVAVANTIERSDKVELVTCYDVNSKAIQATVERYGCQSDTSYEDMVGRDDLDGIVIVSPNMFHREQTELAVTNGKHVYVEKPIANTLADGRAMTETCEAAGKTLMIGHVHRRHSVNRKVKELVDQGALGKLIMVESNMSSSQGWDLKPDEFRWRGDDTGCPGGSLMTIGVHQADTLNYIFGPIKTVFSMFKKLHIPAAVDDVTSTMFEFESGILGYIGSNFASPRTNWMYVYGTEANLQRTVARLDRRFDIERKMGPDESSRLEMFSAGNAAGEQIELKIGDPLLEEIDEFANCVLAGAKPETDGHASLKALSLVRAAIESAASGKPVHVASME